MALNISEELDKILIPINDETLDKNPLDIQIFRKVLNNFILLIRYFSMLYDRSSPFRTKIPDIIERKEECFNLAGLKSI